MMTLEAFLYTFASGAMFMMSVLGLESAAAASSLDRQSKRFFTAFFAALVISSALYFLELAGYVNPALSFLPTIAFFLQSLLGSTPLPLLAVYLLHSCGEDWRRSALFRVIAALWAAYLALLIFAQFTDFFYYYATPGVQLRLGPGYPLLLAILLAMLLLIALGVVRRRNQLSWQYYRAFLICLFPVTLALCIHVFIPVYSVINFGLAVSAFAMYHIIKSDSVEKDLRQQREIASQRASIAMLQMRPHFIYNTMTTIYYLCDQDSKLAKQVTMDFTTYLRKNFTAIASEDAIPFSDELEHTRAYLAVEQAQFEDDLFVDYDTPHTQFRVPPLTLQPIVENAVKHGMDPDSGPLHILIRTRVTDFGSEIIVEDNGPGFEVAADDEPHIALANIEQRLDMMCNGQMAITPRAGGGTEVTMLIP